MNEDEIGVDIEVERDDDIELDEETDTLKGPKGDKR